MAEIITKIKDFFEEIKFLLHDNTTRYGLTKEEYKSAGFFKKLWLDMEYGIIYDHRGEFCFDPERKRWCYINGKTIIVLNEHFAENGKTFKELLIKAFLYEAEQIEKNERANGEKT